MMAATASGSTWRLSRMTGAKLPTISRAARDSCASDVVQERCAEKGLHAVHGDRYVLVAPEEGHDHPAGQVEYPEAVAPSRVGGARIDERGDAELADAVQLLELLLLDHGQKGPRDVDVLPDRIADRLRVVVLEVVEDAVGFVHAVHGTV
jgi:hypothetical protein